MTTATLHASVQRSRFAQHAVAALQSLLPVAFRATSERTPAESAAFEAQKVRNLAYTYAKTDPGFAADLYAAAARHEGVHAE